MKKHLGISLLAIMVILGSSLALAAQSGFKITLLLAQERAQENDLQPILDQLNIEDKAAALESAQEAAEEIDYIVGLPKTRLADKITKYVYPLQAEMNLELAERQEAENQEQLKIDVDKAYQSLWLIQKELETAQKSSEISQVEYHAQEIRFQNDQITATALAASQYILDNQELQVREIEYKLRKAQYELNQLMGRSLEDSILLEDTVNLSVPDNLDLDIDMIYEQALVKSTSVYMKQIDAELADLRFQYTAEEFSKITDEHQDAWYARELARIELEDTKASIWLSINNDYHQLLNNLDNYALQKKSVELKHNEYQVAYAEYNAGKISKLALLQSEQQWVEAQYTLASIMINLNSNWQTFCQQYAIN